MTKATKKPAAKKATTNSSANFLESANIVHALAYVPYLIGAVAMYFLGKSDKKTAMHHIKYSALIAVAVIVLSILLKGFFGQILALGYLAVSAYLAWKAYKGEDVHVEILDTIEEKISEKVKK